MNHTAQVIVRFADMFVAGRRDPLLVTLFAMAMFPLAYCTCWLLSLFLWAWLAAVLSALITVAASHTETGLATVERASDLAVEGAAHAINAFRSLRARLTA